MKIHEIVYMGGTMCLPGLDDDCICLSGGFRGKIETPFSRGTVVGGGIGDPITILARGLALQAGLTISSINDSDYR
jgi:heat shock protein 1/8